MASTSEEHVYNKKRGNMIFFAMSCCSTMASFDLEQESCRLRHFQDVIERDEAIFHDVRQHGMLFAQPLTNFVTHGEA